MERVFTLVCSALTGSDGRRLAGCGKGWTTTNRTEACGTCGELGEVRDVVLVQELAS